MPIFDRLCTALRGAPPRPSPGSQSVRATSGSGKIDTDAMLAGFTAMPPKRQAAAVDALRKAQARRASEAARPSPRR